MCGAAAIAGAWALLRSARRRVEAHRHLSSEAQAQAAAATLMRDHVIASASHDLKTPLASIRLLAHLIKRDARQGALDPAQVVQRIELIETNVARMSSLIGELLDVARLQGGQDVMLQPARTDLVALAQHVAANIDVAADAHRVAVSAEEPELVGWWDANRLERVLTNLVANALKYSPAGGEVAIRLSRRQRAHGDWAVIEIADQGLGIPSRDLPHLFEWFHRGGNVGGLPGTGVGLASAKHIVERHGGTIDVRSRLGKGTTVRLELPVMAPAGVRREEQVQRDSVSPQAVERSSSGRR
jgi:signal transduction histidine kinase